MVNYYREAFLWHKGVYHDKAKNDITDMEKIENKNWEIN